MDVVSKKDFDKLEERVKVLEKGAEYKELLDANQAATYLNVSKQGLYSMVKNMKIPTYRTGKKLYFKRSEIDSIITKQ